MSNLATKLGACILPFTLAACGTIGGRTAGMEQQKIANVPEMSQVAAVRDPCNSVEIEAVPKNQMPDIQYQQSVRRDYDIREHNGWVLISKEPIASKFGPLGGLVVGAVAGSAIGGGSARLLFGTAGAIAGTMVGEAFSNSSRENYLVNLAACRYYLNQVGPAPLREFITDGPADRPHGAPARVFDNNDRYYQKIAPYAPTSPGGSRDPNLRIVPRRCFGC